MGLENKYGYTNSLEVLENRKFQQESVDQMLSTDVRLSQEKPESYSCFKGLLGKIEKDTLWDVYKHYAEKSGVPKGVLNNILDRIYLGELPDEVGAHFDFLSNAIVFNEKIVQNLSQEEFLLLLSHELVHATSYVNIFESKEEKEISVDVGFQNSSAWVGFNEGVTERLAQEISIEYSRRSGEDTTEVRKKIVATGERMFLYSIFMSHVGEIARRIDENAGLEQGTAWRAMIKGAFTGELLKSPQLEELLKETFGLDFVNRYEKIGLLSSFKDLGEFDSNYEMRPLHKDSRALNDWLEFLHLNRLSKEEEENIDD